MTPDGRRGNLAGPRTLPPGFLRHHITRENLTDRGNDREYRSVDVATVLSIRTPHFNRQRAPHTHGGAFTFMRCWNEFVAQILNTRPGTTTLPPVIAASGFLGAFPAVLLVLIFQKYMVQGLTAGSVKG